MASGIYDFVFYNILKYDYSSSVLTGDLQHDIIFGLLIPSIFVVLILKEGVGTVFSGSNKVISYLSMITGLGVIVTLGWIPLIAGFGGFVFVILIAGYFITTFYKKLVSPGHERALGDLAGKAGAVVGLGDVVLTLNKEQKRKYTSELSILNKDYNESEKAVKKLLDALGIKDVGQVNVSASGDDANSFGQTQIMKHQGLRRAAKDSAVKLLTVIPIYERKNFIKKCTDGEFNKELNKAFGIIDKLP